jgi:hypothetical protein
MKPPRSRSLIYSVCSDSTPDFGELGQQALGDFVVGVGQDLAAALVNDVLGNHPTNQKVIRNGNLLDPAASSSRMCLAVIRLSLAMISFPDGSLKSKRATSPAQTLWNQRKLDYLLPR